MKSRTDPAASRARLAFVSLVALVLWTAETCVVSLPPLIRILTPKPGLDATYAPLLLEIDFWAFADTTAF